MAELYPYPRFSLIERDRRWNAVRELMRQHRLDVIVTPQNSGHSTDYQANSRYLTHVGGGGDADVAAIFPLEGEVTAIATSAAPRWPTVQDWTNDVREARRNYGRVIVQRLNELNLERGRIGITGLGEVEGTRTPEGTIFYGTWKQIREAFPHAELVDATSVLTEVRYVKSQEELDALAKSMEIIELAFEAEIEAARPGVSDWVVWAANQYALMRYGSTAHAHSSQYAHLGAWRPDYQRNRSFVDRLPFTGGAAGLCRGDRSRACRADQGPERSIQSRSRELEAWDNRRRAG
jgi:Xaa-Pro aminopeptidase